MTMKNSAETSGRTRDIMRVSNELAMNFGFEQCFSAALSASRQFLPSKIGHKTSNLLMLSFLLDQQLSVRLWASPINVYAPH